MRTPHPSGNSNPFCWRGGREDVQEMHIGFRLQHKMIAKWYQEISYFKSQDHRLCFFKLFQTSDTLKYHVVEHYLTEENIRNGEEFSSWRGMNYLVKITKPGAGMVCNTHRICQYKIDFHQITISSFCYVK